MVLDAGLLKTGESDESSFHRRGTALVAVTAWRVDEPAIRRLTRRQLDAGIHVLPCGRWRNADVGDERRRVVELVVEENAGRALVLPGPAATTPGSDSHRRRNGPVRRRRHPSVTPYYNRPTSKAVRAPRSRVRRRPSCYNVPGRTGCNIDPATVRLSEIPNIVGVKEVRQHQPDGGDLPAVPEAFRALRR
jgi:4-hydroxy-tetrahydrodipicolinate synthase